MLEAVLVLLLGVHLLLVDVAMIGPLASVWLDWRSGAPGDATMEQAGLTAGASSLRGALTLGIVLGVVLLGARWHMNNGAYLEAVSALPRSRLWFAGFELLFYFACMGAYTGLWRRWRRWRFAAWVAGRGCREQSAHALSGVVRDHFSRRPAARVAQPCRRLGRVSPPVDRRRGAVARGPRVVGGCGCHVRRARWPWVYGWRPRSRSARAPFA